MEHETLNISLPPHLAALVRQRVDAGVSSSASDVVREALHRMLLPDEPFDTDDAFDGELAAAAVDTMRRLGDRLTLGEDLSLRDLIDEGRRR